jgi:hypothetical protein
VLKNPLISFIEFSTLDAFNIEFLMCLDRDSLMSKITTRTFLESLETILAPPTTTVTGARSYLLDIQISVLVSLSFRPESLSHLAIVSMDVSKSLMSSATS